MEQQLPPPQPPPPPGQFREVKSSGLAIVMSCIWVGLGQLYAGEIQRGIIMMVAWPFAAGIGLFAASSLLGALGFVLMAMSVGELGSAFISLLFALIALVFVALPAAYWIWGMLDAKKLCERWNAQL